MKKTLSYFLLILLMAIFVSACSSDELVTQEDDESTYSTYIILRADAKNEQVTLEWTYESSAKTYNIYYIQSDSDTQPTYDDLKANGKKIVGADANITTAPYTVPGLENGKKYWFSITGVNSSGVEGKLATPTYATPTSSVPLPAPENVRANAGNQQVTVTWTPVTGADHYVVYCEWFEASAEESYIKAGAGSITTATGEPLISSQIVGPIYWTYGTGAGTTTSLINGRIYYFYVTAVNDSGEESSPSFYDGATPSSTPPPSAPVLTTVETGTFYDEESNEYNTKVTWSASSTTSPAITSYNIYIGTAKNVTKSSGVVTSFDADPPYEAFAMLNSGTYYIFVTATNANGESARSNEMPVTIP